MRIDHFKTKMATPSGLCQLICFFIICLSCIAGDIVDEEFEGSRTLVLEHSFTTAANEAYVKRGTIVIQSLKGNKAQFTEAVPFSQKDRDSLRAAVANGGLYRVRIPVKASGSSVETFVSSATTACNILESGLNDVITISFDQAGEVIGVSVHGNLHACTGVDVPSANLTYWHTQVDITTTVSGPSPDTQTYIDKMKRDEQEKAKNQDGDNRSFLAKYWMYIVPVVIMMVVMSSADQGQQGGGGGGGR